MAKKSWGLPYMGSKNANKKGLPMKLRRLRRYF